MKKILTFENYITERSKHKFSVGDFITFDNEKARINKVYSAHGKDMYAIGSSKHGTIEIEAEEVDSTNEAVDAFKPGDISVPGAYNIKWTTTDLDLGKGIFAKQYDFEFEMLLDFSSLAGEKIKQSVVMSISDDSTGVFALGDDIEKFSGLTLKDAKEYNETPDDAYIYGLCNIMNGGKDMYFWTNGKRMAGAAEASGSVMSAVIEQVAHEAGVHLTRQLLVKMVAQKLGADITNEEWITYDYGFGEYSWPAIGDANDDTPEIIAIDEETFATSGSAVISMLTDGFFEMAVNYLPNLPKLK